MLVSQAGLARRLNVSKTSVFRAVQKGRITVTPDGKIDLEPALLAWSETKDISQDHRKKSEADHPGDDESYQEWLSRKVKAQALKIELELEEMNAHLISTERVNLIWADVIRKITVMVEAIPVKGAALCVGKGQKAVKEILDRLTGEALNEVADLSKKYL